jgi:ferredoxin
MSEHQAYRLLYFSGTGNTEWVMRRIGEALEASGVGCELLRCDQLLADCGMGPGGEADADRICEQLQRFLDGATHLLLGYPVYESTVPKPMRVMLDLLPDGGGIKLGVVCTYMMAGGDCCHLPEKVLAERGYDSVLATYVKMPNNINIPPVRFLHIPQGDELKPFEPTARAAVDEIVAWLREGRSHVEGRGIADYLIGVGQRWSEELATRYVQDHLLALACCNRCRLCTDTCPMGNIGFDAGYPEFGDRCCDCLRCYHMCPQRAIQVTDATMDQAKYPRYEGFDGWEAPRIRKVRKRRKHKAPAEG